MRKLIPLFALFLLIGCDGAQHGRFCSSGHQSLALSSHTGWISIVEGSALTGGGTVDPRQNLLHLIIVCPGLQARRFSVGGGYYGRYVTTLSYTWSNRSGSFPVSIRWDRRADTVTIGGRDFSREKGNVFVVRRESTGQVIGQQVDSLGPKASFQEVLRHAQERLPNDELVASLRADEPQNCEP